MKWLFVDGDYLLAYLYFRGPEVVQTFWLEVASYAERFEVGRVAIAWDDRKGKRRALYPEYKKGRLNLGNWQNEKPEIKKEVLEFAPHFPVIMGRMPDLEADDLIWIWTRKAEGTIISGDQDLWQCLKEGVNIWMPRPKRLVGEKDLVLEYGGNQNAMLLQRCLIGDRSDNIPGVEGIGEKRARELWDKYGSELVKVAIADAEFDMEECKDKWLKAIVRSKDIVKRNWLLMKFEMLIEDAELVLGEIILEKEVKFEIENARRYAAQKGWHLIFQRWNQLVEIYSRL